VKNHILKKRVKLCQSRNKVMSCSIIMYEEKTEYTNCQVASCRLSNNIKLWCILVDRKKNIMQLIYFVQVPI